jgi:hypothetical protein
MTSPQVPAPLRDPRVEIMSTVSLAGFIIGYDDVCGASPLIQVDRFSMTTLDVFATDLASGST